MENPKTYLVKVKLKDFEWDIRVDGVEILRDYRMAHYFLLKS